MKYFVLLLLLAICSCTPIPIPGAAHILEGIGVLKHNRKPQLFEIAFTQSRVTPNDKYKLPDGVEWNDIDECIFVAKTDTVSTMKEYIQTQSSKTEVKGKFEKFSGSFSQETKDVREQLEKHDRSVSVTRIGCKQYSLRVWGYPKLKPFVIANMKNLPIPYNKTLNYEQYETFFEFFGDHITTHVTLGGLMEKKSYTSNDYMKTHTTHSVKTKASASFYVEINHSDSRKSELTTEWNHATISESIIARGGDPWRSGESSWTSWAHSTENRPQIMHEKLADISIIFQKEFLPNPDVIPDIIQRRAEMKQALHDYLIRPGCTNPTSPNYTTNANVDDGSCTNIKIPKCYHVVYARNAPANLVPGTQPGAWISCNGHGSRNNNNAWVVTGADSRGKCVVAWSYRANNGGEAHVYGKSYGTTAEIQVMRSDDYACRYGGDGRVSMSSNMGVSCSGGWSCGRTATVTNGQDIHVSVSRTNGRGSFSALALVWQNELI
jgi:hypothetical protein